MDKTILRSIIQLTSIKSFKLIEKQRSLLHPKVQALFLPEQLDILSLLPSHIEELNNCVTVKKNIIQQN